MAAACSAEGSPQKRKHWPFRTAKALIHIWEDNLQVLRANTRNARIYVTLAAALNASLPPGEGLYSVKQVQQKMGNLNKNIAKCSLIHLNM